MTGPGGSAATPWPTARPLYARVLRLRHLRLSGVASFVLLEGMLAVAVLLALTELVSWWAVPLLPLAAAVMVKLNDLIAGATRRPGRADGGPTPPPVDPDTPARTVRPVRQVSRDVAGSLDPVKSPRQRFRQSARRRYR